MGRTGITYNDVKNAIAKLQGLKKQPTVDNIRHALGTGSKSTIAKHLREWKDNNEITNTDESGMPLEVLQFVRGLWKKLNDDADEQIVKYKSEADAKINEAQNAYLKTQQAYTQLQAELHQLEEKVHQRTQTIQSLQEKITLQDNENAKYLERLDALSNKNEENNAENARLHQLLKNTQDNLTHYQQAVQAQRQEQTLILEKQSSEYEQKIKTASHQNEQLTAQILQLQSENKQLIQANDSIEKSQQTLQKQHEKIITTHEALKQLHEQLNASHEALKYQHEKLEQASEHKTNELIDLKIQIKSLSNHNNDLTNALSISDNKSHQLRHELDVARHEKSYLEGQLAQLQKALEKNNLATV